MRLYAMRRGLRLEPANIESQAVLEKIPERKMIRIDAVQERNAAQNALYWSLLSRIADWLDQPDVNAEVLHQFMKLECGIYHIVKMPNGETRKIPGSTAFSKLDQGEFAEFFEKAVQITYNKLQVPPELVADLLTPTMVAA